MFVSDIETPALIIDLDKLENNQKKMMELVSAKGSALRPHYKSHKSTAIAHMQMAAGAKGITCAKLSEAEDLVFAGIEDVLIANQVVEPSKVSRLAYLAGCCKLTVCVDDAENVLMLEKAAEFYGSKIYCLIEFDIGMNRCGVYTREEVLKLAQLISAQPHLVFEGIQAYAGHLAHEENYEKRLAASRKIEDTLRALVSYLEENGLKVNEVSGTSTGTIEIRNDSTVYTEIQAGTYLFMDAAYGRVGVGFEHSLFMLATVLSADSEKVVSDAGMKSLGVDQGGPVFVDFPNEIAEMSEEHSAVYCKNNLKVGDKIKLIPGHSCTTMNLHDKVYFVRGEKVVDRITINSRGKSL